MGFFNKCWDLTVKAAKTVSGYQAYQDRKEAKRLKEDAEILYQETIQENEKRRKVASVELEDFGKIRLKALQDTVGVFLKYLTIMKHHFRDKEYELTGVVNLKAEDIQQLESVELTAKESLGTTAVAGSVAAAAVAGVPSVVTSAVSYLGAAASTGTVIADLSGAAATNATLAWLGGGSLAAGGGGMAAGSAVLAGITGASAGIVALAAIGIVAGMHYSKKRTMAEDYYAKVCEYRKKAECGWALIDGIVKRAHELKRVTLQLQEAIHSQLPLLEPLIYDFNSEDKYYLETFQGTALLVKSMSELSQTPILDKQGYVSEASSLEIEKIDKILNRDL